MTRSLFTMIGIGVALALFPNAASQAGQNVVVVLDDSGSMKERMKSRKTRIEAAKSAILAVLETLPESANVGVTLLNGRIDRSSWVVPLGPVDIEKSRTAIRQVRAKGGTPLGRFMKVGTDALLQMRRDDHYGDYRLLIVTDGEANDGRLVERYLPDILSRGISVDVIGVDMAEDHSLANQVSSYRRADDPDMLVEAVREVFAEISQDGPDEGESDFELLSALSPESAAAAILALSESDNRPIGESRRAQRNGSSSTQDGRSPGGSSQSPPRRTGRFGFFLTLFIAFGIFSMLKAVFRNRRR